MRLLPSSRTKQCAQRCFVHCNSAASCFPLRRPRIASALHPHPENPLFARNIANRYWGYLMGRGIVEPVDDMRVTNPPSNPELLEALAAP